MRFSKKIVCLVIGLNVAYVLLIAYLYLKVQSEPTVLTGSWFAFTTVELWQLGNIKNHETKNKEDKTQ